MPLDWEALELNVQALNRAMRSLSSTGKRSALMSIPGPLPCADKRL